LKIEKVLLQLLVRSVHGHTLPAFAVTADLVRASTLTCLRRRPRIPVIRLAAAPSACYSAGARRPGFAAARGSGRNHQGGTRWV